MVRADDVTNLNQIRMVHDTELGDKTQSESYTEGN